MLHYYYYVASLLLCCIIFILYIRVFFIYIYLVSMYISCYSLHTRCYDRYGLGQYWRAYFHCEEGTQFSDELDQCIFPSQDPIGCATFPPEPCKVSLLNCRQENICPISQLGKATVDIQMFEIPFITYANTYSKCHGYLAFYNTRNSVVFFNSLHQKCIFSSVNVLIATLS